ncbi:MAG: transposase [Candidatus Microthrix sp.]|nr:transposase [Candidatus Microthrix sp.]
MNPRCLYSKEFKIEAVRSVIESSRTYSDVANELSIHKDTLRKWVREVKKDRLEDDTSNTADDKKEVRDLKRENKRLKDQRDFLKSAAAFVCG